MKRKKYDKLIYELQIEIGKLQNWVRQTGFRAAVIFEGRDAAGKGGTIKALTQFVSPRTFRVEALPAPSDRERTEWYFQRYVRRLPAAGEIVIFDRSWYNRAGVEPVMGFCTDEQRDHFLTACPIFEQQLISDGIMLFKYWLEVGSDEQLKRLQDRIDDPLKQWKLSSIDLAARRKWYAYSKARDRMFAATDVDFSPWNIVRADDKRLARLNCISHLLDNIPYSKLPHDPIELLDRTLDDQYDDVSSMHDRRYVPERY